MADGTAGLRLVLVIAGLTGGGAERVLSTLANEWSSAGHQVTIVTLDPEAEDFYPLKSSVHRVRLRIDPSSRTLLHRAAIEFRLLRALRSELRRLSPNAVIAFSTETNVRVLLASLGLGLTVLVSERTDPAAVPLGPMWRLLRRASYGLAHAVAVQTKEAQQWIAAHTSARRAVVIPNPVMSPEWSDEDRVELPQPLVVTLARLRPEKGIDLLIDAFARTRSSHAEWHLAIIGDGPERAALERQVASLSLADAVTFVGSLARPTATLRQGQLFVLPSRFEGFPNALIEAMALGLPVVSFDCPSGPRAIVRNEVDGVLVRPGSVDAMATAMSRLMSAPDTRARLGGAARDVIARFAVDRVLAQWLAVLQLDPDTESSGMVSGAQFS